MFDYRYEKKNIYSKKVSVLIIVNVFCLNIRSFNYNDI